jgi:hypothetical protein
MVTANKFRREGRRKHREKRAELGVYAYLIYATWDSRPHGTTSFDVQLSLCLAKYHAMKTYWEVEV